MKYFGVSDKGLVRNINQDSYSIITSENGDVFAVVCDGIGGAKGGDIASRMVIDYFSKHFSEHTGFMDLDDAISWLRLNITKINMQIYSLANANENYKGMGTTLSGILFSTVGKLVVNVGDSRVYSFNYEDEFKQLTEDHSLVNDMLKHNEITLEEAMNHPKRNVLTNAIGVWSSVKIDIIAYQLPTKYFLICSDGLHGYVSKESIKEVLMDINTTTSLKPRALLNLALKAGGYDNITIILIEVEKGDN